MKHWRDSSIYFALLFLLLGACAPNVPGKLEQQSPGSGQQLGPAGNNPAGLILATVTPTSAIRSDPGLQAFVPTACIPPQPALFSATAFCANKSAGVGGATITVGAPGGAFIDSSVVNCTSPTTGPFKLTCTGPQGTSFHISSCGSCGPSDKPGSAVFGNYTCAKGYSMHAGGSCLQSSDPGYFPCPAGSHYDNDQQDCIDDSTQQKVVGLCPPGTVAYLPDYHYCLTKHYPEIYNCQTFDVSLGSCSSSTRQEPSSLCEANPSAPGCSIPPPPPPR